MVWCTDDQNILSFQAIASFGIPEMEFTNIFFHKGNDIMGRHMKVFHQMPGHTGVVCKACTAH